MDDICRRDMRLECLKLMLLADADPTLESSEDITTFRDELRYGTVVSSLTIALIVYGCN
jgi:hypothetical protein